MFGIFVWTCTVLFSVFNWTRQKCIPRVCLFVCLFVCVPGMLCLNVSMFEIWNNAYLLVVVVVVGSRSGVGCIGLIGLGGFIGLGLVDDEFFTMCQI